MKEQLIKKLNEVVEGGTKKSTLETEIGLPSNSLSAVLAGHKEMPDKWIEKINAYLNKGAKPEEPPRTKIVSEPTGLKERPSNFITDKMREVNDKINKDFGDGTVMFFGDKPTQDYEVISTGSLKLDEAIGIGGLPRGRMVEIYGLESSGKTTIALHVIANAQKQGLRCFMVDAENSFDPEYAEALGIKIDEMGYCQPSNGEQGLEVADRQIATGMYGVMVIDSVAALIPKSELEGQMGDNKMGAHARLMSQACRKLVGSIAKTNTLCIFINQIRNKIGIMFGNPEVTTGGMALQFYASIRLSVSRSTTEENSVMNGEIKEGNMTTVKVIKNKCSSPFKQAKFNIIYGVGIDRLGEVIDLAIENKIIDKASSWYSYGESKLGQGKSGIKQLLLDNPDLLSEIEGKLLKKD